MASSFKYDLWVVIQECVSVFVVAVVVVVLDFFFFFFFFFSTSCIELSPYPLCRHFLLGLVYKFNAHLNVMSKFGTV